ncbi:MAG: Na+/H+ antiporter subunit E [Dysgonamonadaceae bacterium]|nr:Na+/H+ antiporter subunit E [Dysgonamonadaceae bacterium]MDD4729821.1 Na+/H+ antiporter subunit E [Dysgonamonadaceae bacterium]
MIRLLRWLGIIALIVTLATHMMCGDSISLERYIAIYFGVSIIGWLTSFIYARKTFFQVVYLAELIVFFLWELIKANFEVAYEVVTPSHNMTSGIIAVPLDTKTDLEITIFSSLVTLTPGTLSIDVSADKSHLFVHTMYIENGDTVALVNELKNGFERKVIRVFE